MTSSSPDKPSLYSIENPNIPTFFTDKLIDVISSGLDNNKSYYEVGEIFEEVKKEFEKTPNMPIPQQSSFNEAEKIPVGNNLREFSLREVLKKNRELNLELKTLELELKTIKEKFELEKSLSQNIKLKNSDEKSRNSNESNNQIKINGESSEPDKGLKAIFFIIVGIVIIIAIFMISQYNPYL